GTCLNEGCVPAKNFLETSSYIAKANYFKNCGVTTNSNTLNIEALQSSTNVLIDDLKTAIHNKLKKAKVTTKYGIASFIDPHTIKVDNEINETISAENIVIASGSSHRDHPLLKLESDKIISSREVFELKEIPKSLLIIGGGAIGCEFASFYNALGTEVEIAEFTPNLVPAEDSDIAKALKREFEKKGMKVYLNANVSDYTVLDDGVKVQIDLPKKSEEKSYEKVLVSIGRVPNSDSLELDTVGIESDRGFIEVNENLQTTKYPHIYAIGDVIKSPALAHVAYYEAKRVAQMILEEEVMSDEYIWPAVTFSTPQIGSIGKGEKELKEAGITFKNKKLFLKSNAKAKIKGDDSGFVKVLYEEESQKVLGASIIGTDATELIHQFLIAINAKLTLKDLEKMVFAHPTLSESTLDLLV
ncbi:MAG TPA: NAD(P)/FAD-dependent oxidoreductase, partial [Campylobacterales bacterium]|nr:NAD(P)/FAD-dependent oxidoreductase [Campylobacterales bacterium]